MSDAHEKQLDDGWTHVSRGKPKEPVYVHGLNPQSRDMTVAKVRGEFDSKRKIWRNSSCYQEVRQILDRHQPEDGWQIGDAVCVATGSFSRDNWQNRQRSLMQFAAFTAIVQYLQDAQTTKILCYAQEPEFTQVDIDFLTSMGLTNIRHDEASDYPGLGAAGRHLNASTFVFEPFMDLGVKSTQELFGDGVRLYIGSSMQRWIDHFPKSATHRNVEGRPTRGLIPVESSTAVQHKSNLEQVRQSVQSRRSYKFPRFEQDPNVFEGIRISWKEPQEDEEG